MCSFDIENTYTNILKLDIINIITRVLNTNSKIDENSQKEIIHTLKLC
jgi:hypothetical protein